MSRLSDQRIEAEPNACRFTDSVDLSDEMAIHLAPPTVDVSESMGFLSVSGYGPPVTAIKVVFPDGSTDLTRADEHGRYAVVCRRAQPRGTVSVTVLNANGHAGLMAVNRYFGASVSPTQPVRLTPLAPRRCKAERRSDFADTVV
jgi:hypothetical protein